MNITHNRVDESEVVLTTARCQLPLFGRWLDISITSYCANGATAVTFGIQQLATKDITGGNRWSGLSDGKLQLSKGDGGNRQIFEQLVESPKLAGQFLDWSDLSDGGVPAGRTVSKAFLRKTESIIETIRLHIRKHLHQGSICQATDVLHSQYGPATRIEIKSFLHEINWRFMFEHAGCDTDCMNVIDTSLRNNPVEFHPINFRGESEIPVLTIAELVRFDSSTLADMKATSLLRHVCGDELATEFSRTGAITIKRYGYRFRLRPNQFADCVDPNGKTARLCIHTTSFSVHPIDELVIAYLHIKHRFAEYMKMAVPHGAHREFQKIPKDVA